MKWRGLGSVHRAPGRDGDVARPSGTEPKAKIYLEQETERKKLLDERAAMLREARARAVEEVGAAKERVARELAEAVKQVEASAVELAREIARRVLRVPPAPGSPAREAR